MTREEAVKELRETGAIYFRANHSIHFETTYGFWENYKGHDGDGYKSLDDLIKAIPELDELIQKETAQ